MNPGNAAMPSSKSTKRIIVVGKLGVDIFAQVDDFPKYKQKVFGKSMHIAPGGLGGNQALAARRLGGNVMLVSRIGNDEFGKMLLGHIKKEGMSAKYITVSKSAPTGASIVILDRKHENTIISIPGVIRQFSAADIAPLLFAKNDIVVTQLGVPLAVVHALFRKAKKSGATTLLNCSPAIKCPRQIFLLSDYLVMNENEAAFFSGNSRITDNPDIAAGYARRIRLRKSQTVIITLGDRGCVALDPKGIVKIKARKVKVVDTTGAGDTFLGAFAAALSKAMPLTEALAFSNRAASISIQRPGASSSPTLKEMGIRG